MNASSVATEIPWNDRGRFSITPTSKIRIMRMCEWAIDSNSSKLFISIWMRRLGLWFLADVLFNWLKCVQAQTEMCFSHSHDRVSVQKVIDCPKERNSFDSTSKGSENWIHARNNEIYYILKRGDGCCSAQISLTHDIQSTLPTWAIKDDVMLRLNYGREREFVDDTNSSKR